MKIQFKVKKMDNGIERCIDFCDKGYEGENVGVGSVACQCCKYNDFTSLKDHYVLCSYYDK